MKSSNKATNESKQVNHKIKRAYLIMMWLERVFGTEVHERINKKLQSL
jgi:hypothetical protein